MPVTRGRRRAAPDDDPDYVTLESESDEPSGSCQAEPLEPETSSEAGPGARAAVDGLCPLPGKGRSSRAAQQAAARQQALGRLAAAKQGCQRVAPAGGVGEENDGGESPAGPAVAQARRMRGAVVLSSDEEAPSGPHHHHQQQQQQQQQRCSGSEEEAAASSDSELRAARTRQRWRRPPAYAASRGRRSARFVAGGTERYSDWEEDADLDGFIAGSSSDEGEGDDDDEEEGGSGGGSSSSSEGPSPSSPAAAAAGSGSRLKGAGGGSGGGATDSNDEDSLAAPVCGGASGRGGKRRRHGAGALVVDSSSEEDELPSMPAQGRSGSPGTAQAAVQPPRKRLRRGPSTTGQAAAAGRLPAAAAPATATVSVPQRAERAARRRASAAERIQRAQQRWQQRGDFQHGEASTSSSSSGEESEGGGEGEEGPGPAAEAEPAAAAVQGGGADVARRPSARRGRDQEENWRQQAAAVLGIGGYSEQELFAIYVEYLLLCLVDPTYAEAVQGSPRHREYYRRAVVRIEGELALKREAVASNAWRSSARGLLAALESLPGIATDWASEECGGEAEDATCAACNRRRSHATRLLVLKGRPYAPSAAAAAGGQGTSAAAAAAAADATLVSPSGGGSRRLSDQFMASPVFARHNASPGASGWQGSGPLKEGEVRAADGRQEEQGPHAGKGSGNSHGSGSGAAGGRSDEEEVEEAGRGGRYRRQEFSVGRYCCARLSLYHALFHWRHRLAARLKRELKAELRRRKRQGQRRERSDVAEALLRRESLVAGLHRNYRTLLELSEKYQLSGGEGSTRGNWQAEFEGMQAEVTAALYELHSDSEGEEVSVAWPDERRDESSDESGHKSDGSASSWEGGLHIGGRREGGSRRSRAPGAGRGLSSTGDSAADRLLGMLRAAAQAPAGSPQQAAAAAGAPTKFGTAGGSGGSPAAQDSPPSVDAREAAAVTVRAQLPATQAGTAPRSGLPAASQAAAARAARRWLSVDSLLVRKPPGKAAVAAGDTPISPHPTQHHQQEQQRPVPSTPAAAAPGPAPAVLQAVGATPQSQSGSRGSGLRQVGIRSFFGASPPPSFSAGKGTANPSAAADAAPSRPGDAGAGGRAGWRPRGLGAALDQAADT